MKKLISSLLAVLCLMNLALAAETSDVRAQLFDGVVWVDGTKSDFVDGQGKWAFPLSYQGTVYIPLRTAGDWMGAAVAWDQKTQTVLLTTGGEPRVYQNYDGPAPTDGELAQMARWRETGVEVALRPDLTVKVDGAVQAFTNVKGEPVYPVVFQNVTYLPVRSIGQFCGKEVLWVQGTDNYPRERVVLFDAVTPAQRQEAETYLAQEQKLLQQLTGQVEALAATEKRTDEAGLELLRGIQATLKEMSALSAPTAPYFAEGSRCVREGARQMKQQFVDFYIGQLTGKTSTFAELKSEGVMDYILDEWVGNMSGNLGNLADWLSALAG